jgi:hypothetical protein
MRDYFEIEGVRYIPTRRAAEITGYAKDYIGQLSRMGKVNAMLVGRNWFVDEQSIISHQKGTVVDAPETPVTIRVIHDSDESVSTTAATPTQSFVVPSVATVAETEAVQTTWSKPSEYRRIMPNYRLLTGISARYYPGHVSFFEDIRPLFPIPEKSRVSESVVYREVSEAVTSETQVTNPQVATQPVGTDTVSIPSPLFANSMLRVSAGITILLCAFSLSITALFTERIVEAKSIAATGTFSVESRYLMNFFE